MRLCVAMVVTTLYSMIHEAQINQNSDKINALKGELTSIEILRKESEGKEKAIVSTISIKKQSIVVLEIEVNDLLGQLRADKRTTENNFINDDYWSFKFTIS